jgi:rfaE bifunctional protein nucleotidyltransferase chain/domain
MKKVVSFNSAILISAALSNSGYKIGLCHGCFDLLHVGHLNHFLAASKLCDYLFISVTPDVFVGKGPNRPIIPENDRIEAISFVSSVDFVFLNNSESSVKLIESLRPNIYFKGNDYNPDAKNINPNFLLEKEAVERNSGKVIITNEKASSTTSIVKKIINNDFEQS